MNKKIWRRIVLAVLIFSTMNIHAALAWWDDYDRLEQQQLQLQWELERQHQQQEWQHTLEQQRLDEIEHQQWLRQWREEQQRHIQNRFYRAEKE